jgi:hypothetical protein
VGNTNQDQGITDPTNDGRKNRYQILEIDGVSISPSEKQRYKVELATKAKHIQCTTIWLGFGNELVNESITEKVF